MLLNFCFPLANLSHLVISKESRQVEEKIFHPLHVLVFFSLAFITISYTIYFIYLVYYLYSAPRNFTLGEKVEYLLVTCTAVFPVLIRLLGTCTQLLILGCFCC